MVKFLNEKTDLTRISSVLSLFTLVAFHWPFFRLVLGNIEPWCININILN